MRPNDRQYTGEHEWLQPEEGDIVVGITDYAASELGDIVFLDLPEVGQEISPGDSMGSIETVKAVEEIYAPVGGVIVAINESLQDNPELVNASPFEDGWLVRVKGNGETVDGLMDAEEYTAMVSAD